MKVGARVVRPERVRRTGRRERNAAGLCLQGADHFLVQRLRAVYPVGLRRTEAVEAEGRVVVPGEERHEGAEGDVSGRADQREGVVLARREAAVHDDRQDGVELLRHEQHQRALPVGAVRTKGGKDHARRCISSRGFRRSCGLRFGMLTKRS